MLDSVALCFTFFPVNTLLSSRGQTVVPSALRRKYGLGLNSRLAWIDEGTSIRVVPLGGTTDKYGIGLTKGLNLSASLRTARAVERAREKRPRSV